MTRLHVLQSDPQMLPKDFWESEHCELMVMARWAQDREQEVAWLHQHLPQLPGHVWIATSGTLASQWIALSKKSLLLSAAAVNEHLKATSTESWGLTLPLAHVGGLGIMARAHLLNQTVTALSQDGWKPSALGEKNWQGHLLSLVPTQVHDLVQQKISPPKSLRAVVVGGDRLSPELYQSALKLGWPLLPSYGLTECGSQIATASPGDQNGKLTPLSHVKLHVDQEDRLWIESEALFTGKAVIEHEKLSWLPRESGAWATQDRAEIAKDGSLTILGRFDSVVKVRGEKVDLSALEIELQKKLNITVIVVALPDERDGIALWAVTEKTLSVEQLNAGLLPHQKLRGIHVLPVFPRTALGKIKRGEIQTMISSSSLR